MSPPTTIILRSSYVNGFGTTKPFCVLHCNELDGYKNIHLCNQDDKASPHAKFRLLRVNPDKGLYNIRCCYNNKLWSSSDSGFIQAADKDAGDATQFKLESVNTDNNTYRLMCMKLQRYVCFVYSKLNKKSDWVLKAESGSPREDSYDVFTMVDWESLVILPKVVALKGDNDKYLVHDHNENNYDSYDVTGTDIGDRRIAVEIVALSDNKIAVYDPRTTKYWTHDDRYRYQGSNPHIFVVPTSNVNSRPDSQFVAIKYDRNVIALKNVDLGTYCIRKDDFFECSEDKGTTICEEAKLRLEEPVISRKVYGVDFRFDDSLIYNENIVTKTSDRTANSLDKKTKKELKLECQDSTSSSYDTSVSVKTIGAFSLDATIPFIVDKFSFTPRAEFTKEKAKKYSWGETKVTSFTITIVVRVTVPSKKEVMANLDATEAKCDIPFSYTQRDLLTKGEYVVQTKDDGIYTCSNSYNFNISIKEQATTS